MINSMQHNNNFLIVGSWFNAILGTVLFAEPILSTTAYLFSIAGSVVYIYTTIKKNKNEKTIK
jgi:hypothetical protein